MKIYDLVKKILTEIPETRNSDRLLIWSVWKSQGLVSGAMIAYDDYMEKAASTESVCRCRRKIQEDHQVQVDNGSLAIEDSLLPTKSVKSMRKEIEDQRGTHIYREQVKMFDTNKFYDNPY